MHRVLPEPSLLSHIHKMGVFMAYFISQCLNKPKHACSLVRNFTTLTHVQKWAYIWHIPSVDAQTRISMRAVSQGPSMLSHMHTMGVHTACSFSQCSDEP